MQSLPALLIFIKNLSLGQVKTRLAATLGNEAALDIYLQLLEHTRQTALQCRAQRYLFYSDFVETEDGWQEAEFTKKAQHGADLGQRMANAFAETLGYETKSGGNFELPPDLTGAKKAVLIGSDIPQLSVEILEEAFQQLDAHDFALGPALDGGYYLIGMKEAQAAVFQEIEWSTPAVFRQTMERIEALGKSCFVLPTLSDIDTEEDWKRNRNEA